LATGNAGNIFLQAGESLTLQGNDYENRVEIDVYTYEYANVWFLSGDAGSLEMHAKKISLPMQSLWMVISIRVFRSTIMH